MRPLKVFISSLILFAICSIPAPTCAGPVYSGLQNISLQGIPNTIKVFTVDLADDLGTWDRFQLSIADDSLPGSIGTNDIYSGAEVALASLSGDFPFVSRFGYGDAYPSRPIFGSGSKLLWSGSSAADGDFFAAMQFGTFGTGPEYSGWIHLNVENSSTPSAAITVIDWAYSDVVGETIAMGQVPEPSSFALLGSSLVSGMLFGAARRQWKCGRSDRL